MAIWIVTHSGGSVCCYTMVHPSAPNTLSACYITLYTTSYMWFFSLHGSKQYKYYVHACVLILLQIILLIVVPTIFKSGMSGRPCLLIGYVAKLCSTVDDNNTYYIPIFHVTMVCHNQLFWLLGRHIKECMFFGSVRNLYYKPVESSRLTILTQSAVDSYHALAAWPVSWNTVCVCVCVQLSYQLGFVWGGLSYGASVLWSLQPIPDLLYIWRALSE